MRINGLSCCGVAELSSLSLNYSTPGGASVEAEKLWRMCVDQNPLTPEEGFYYRCRYVMFTQASRPGDDGDITNQRGYGFDFAQFIRDNSLGEVIDSIPSGINPNSSNEVKVWMWIPDMDAVKAWLVAEKTRRGYTYTPPAQPEYYITFEPDDAVAVAEVPGDVIIGQSAVNQPRPANNNLRFARAQMRLLQETLNQRMFTNNTPISRRS